MKRILLTTALALLFIHSSSFAQKKEGVKQSNEPFIVPTLQNWKGRGSDKLEVNRLATISITEESMCPAAELLQKALKAANQTADIHADAKRPNGTIVRLETVNNKKLGKEGYILTIDYKKGITIQAQNNQGLVWGVQTVSQMLENNPQALPLGTTTDVPEYALRGFMIDCGRKFIPMSYLKQLVRCLSHYKMNCLQVHLNDNGFKKYYHNNWDETYAAFRMESDLFPDLTARDGYYTKREFREFVKWAETLGVEIIPEIDCPAHSLAFTHYRKEFANPEFGVDHLDLSNPNVIPFLDSLYSEYLGGPDPVFAGPRVHIGTDEYSNKKQETVEQFRSFTNHYIRLVKKYGKQPKLWGSLTWSRGTTPVDVEGVLMDVWSNDFAQPDSMKQLGYQMVSIPDGWVYIVPAAGYYYDYLNDQMLYEHWTPANINGKQFPEHDPQIEGGMFAVWNDVCGNGISTYDIHHRTMPALQVIAQKSWSATRSTQDYAEWNSKRKNLNDEIAYSWGRLPKESITIPNVTGGKKLAALNSELEGVEDLGYPYSISFDIEAAKERKGTTLFRSNFAQFFISDPVTGRLGFIRDGYIYQFDYSLRRGEKHNIRIDGTNQATTLYVDGRKVQELGLNQVFAADKQPYNIVRTLAFPVEETGLFRSKITNLIIKQTR